MIPMNLLHPFAAEVNSNFEALWAYLLLRSCPWLLLLVGTCCSTDKMFSQVLHDVWRKNEETIFKMWNFEGASALSGHFGMEIECVNKIDLLVLGLLLGDLIE
ncbi:hypothetical protein J1N35_017934 [Gossypium stocksii]|uniref:Uncharacterized protein n=1 Tax=Gossypium stocksii TaxID=47602 RepID=A0A9D3VP64_9ROSI|nr:hypothetical protein J1N35_017934 [Gossypium stocksii]